jgi:hypothetical protein
MEVYLNSIEMGVVFMGLKLLLSIGMKRCCKPQFKRLELPPFCRT